MHPACPNKKQNHLQNSFLRRAQFWVRKTFSKPASLKRASLVGQGLRGQGMPGQGCMGTAGQSAQASTGRSQEPGQGSACYGMLAVVPQVKEDKVRYCQGPSIAAMF